ncbi:hypothetical protein ACQE3E_06630 [Methylomonas sp. MED-D]|uniref:hypothetical protein n=1 Tax=Methylomonas sp. MED-D TaxID=3418768 RepID=UPI003D029650
MATVKITGTAITATHGTLTTGDILRGISDEFAAHLVNDCRVADYLDAAPAAAPVADPVAKPPKKSAKPAAVEVAEVLNDD